MAHANRPRQYSAPRRSREDREAPSRARRAEAPDRAQAACLRSCSGATRVRDPRRPVLAAATAHLGTHVARSRKGATAARPVGPHSVPKPPVTRRHFEDEPGQRVGPESPRLQPIGAATGLRARSACHALGRRFESLQSLSRRPTFAGLFAGRSRLCSCVAGYHGCAAANPWHTPASHAEAAGGPAWRNSRAHGAFVRALACIEAVAPLAAGSDAGR